MIVQTNWAVESKKSRSAISFYKQDENVDNFIAHIEELRPKVILFMGSELLTKVLKFLGLTHYYL
ncbi:hypothetical protein [Acinetobacter gandensis]|uniref:hypothetical protein n=1 Tax=Acinetobacter gandensis TaxID=1443941 RepID=UPI003B0278AD